MRVAGPLTHPDSRSHVIVTRKLLYGSPEFALAPLRPRLRVGWRRGPGLGCHRSQCKGMQPSSVFWISCFGCVVVSFILCKWRPAERRRLKMNLDKCKLVGIFGSFPGVLFILLLSFPSEHSAQLQPPGKKSVCSCLQGTASGAPLAQGKLTRLVVPP